MNDAQIQYRHTSEVHNTRAAKVVVPILLKLFPARSVLDVGCGLGTWLAVFRDKGVMDVVGLDGANVDASMLCIPSQNFTVSDLRSPFDLQRKFDLVLCLEVAEHLPESCAGDLVASLCRHSDRIIFSAAIPGQGGQHHLNEKWPDYWRSLFEKEGYAIWDAIRPAIWDNPEVDVWYRQNMFLYVRKGDPPEAMGHPVQMAEIHPELWRDKVEMLARLWEEVNGFDKGGAGISRSFKALMNAVKNKLLGRR